MTLKPEDEALIKRVLPPIAHGWAQEHGKALARLLAAAREESRPAPRPPAPGHPDFVRLLQLVIERYDDGVSCDITLDDGTILLGLDDFKAIQGLLAHRPSPVGREEVARVIASALGDHFDHAFANKAEWNRASGENGGRYRDINEPMQDDYLAAADAILALFSPVDGWKPIETAPKDGTLILAFCVHPSARYAGEDVSEWTEIVTTRWVDHNGGGWTWNGICGVHTHWQPLPAAPPPPGGQG